MSLLPKPSAIEAARAALAAVNLILETNRRLDGMIDWPVVNRKFKAVERELVDAGFKVTSKWDGTTIAIGGFRSTSTTGLPGALSNWLRRAEAVPA
jgi:hypothetical protein